VAVLSLRATDTLACPNLSVQLLLRRSVLLDAEVRSLHSRTMTDLFTPNRVLSPSALRILIASQICVLAVMWMFSPFVLLPRPTEVLSSFGDLWQQGLPGELITSFFLNVQAILCATVVSLSLSFLAAIPFFRPIVHVISKLRFLSLVGLSLVFTLLATSGHELKLSLLTFSVSVFFITSMADVLDTIPKEQFDLARTLRMGEWRVLWEVIVLGQADRAFDCLRQNAAISWMLLSMVEMTVASEGGIGVMLTNQNHHYHLPAVFAIQLTILFLGLFQDYALGFIKNLCCPYSVLTLERK
jgi:NitT/TauT family transport system permease protein